MKNAVTMTKTEQDSLMDKMNHWAKKEDYTADNIDFSKPLDQQEANDIKKEAL